VTFLLWCVGDLHDCRPNIHISLSLCTGITNKVALPLYATFYTQILILEEYIKINVFLKSDTAFVWYTKGLEFMSLNQFAKRVKLMLIMLCPYGLVIWPLFDTPKVLSL
jgi:hypothetical protein